jgi:N-acetylglucosaminyl-diphospho-decaprenol L-rhamnosyltransferase
MSDQLQLSSSIRLLVVIVNYRTPDLTIDCLQSLEDEVKSLGNVQVVVTDNASGDNSVEKIGPAITDHQWGDWAKFMPLDLNGGFAFGNNAAIYPEFTSSSLPPYVLLLNPDTVVRPGALKALMDFMDVNPKAGIAGSRLEDPDGTSQRSAFRFPSLLSELESTLRFGVVSKLLAAWNVSPPTRDLNHLTGWVAGASMIIRREVFESIGLMDEKYFMYFEEVDFCLRANRAGWECWYVPASRVVHLVGQSSGINDSKRPPRRMPTYWFDSRRRYFVKNHGWFYAMVSDVIWIVCFGLWRCRRFLERRPDFDPPRLLSDFVANSILVKGGQV